MGPLEFGNAEHIRVRDRLAAESKAKDNHRAAAKLLGLTEMELSRRLDPGDAIKGMVSFVHADDSWESGGCLGPARAALRMDCGSLRRLTKNQAAKLERELKSVQLELEDRACDLLGEEHPVRWRA